MKDSFLNRYFSYPGAISESHGDIYLLVGVMNMVPSALAARESITSSRFLIVILPTPRCVPTLIGFEIGTPSKNLLTLRLGAERFYWITTIFCFYPLLFLFFEDYLLFLFYWNAHIIIYLCLRYLWLYSRRSISSRCHKWLSTYHLFLLRISIRVPTP